MSSSGNQWLIKKNVLKELDLLEKTMQYVKSINLEKLSQNKKELLEIWNQKNTFYGD